MTTPPIPPNIPELPPARKSISLAKLAIAFAVIMGITFGLCSVILINSNSSMDGAVFPVSLVIEAICIIGLVVVALMAIIRSNKST